MYAVDNAAMNPDPLRVGKRDVIILLSSLSHAQGDVRSKEQRDSHAHSICRQLIISSREEASIIFGKIFFQYFSLIIFLSKDKSTYKHTIGSWRIIQTLLEA